MTLMTSAYGSNLLTGLVATSPNAFDQIVLTGFTNNVTMGECSISGPFSILIPMNLFGLLLQNPFLSGREFVHGRQNRIKGNTQDPSASPVSCRPSPMSLIPTDSRASRMIM